MAIHMKRSRVVLSVAGVATAVVLASTTLGAGAKVNVSDPGKASAGAFGYATISPGTVAAASCNSYAAPAQGIKVGDHVVLGNPYDLESGLIGSAVDSILNDVLYVRLCNATAAPIPASPKPWAYMVVR